jgi:dihydroorotate dehydrogenase
VDAVSKSCAIPVIVKLSFHLMDIAHIAKICKDAGAQAVSAINTVRGIVGIDINTNIVARLS